MDPKALLRLLVETESPSPNKAAVDRVGAIIMEEARNLGAQVETIPNKETGDHVLCKFSSSSGIGDGGEGGFLLLCHMDTVFPLGTLDQIPYHEADDKIFGP